MLTVEIIGHQKHRCEGCRFLEYPKPKYEAKTPYCSNPRSVWYMRHASGRCELKELIEDEDIEN